MYEKIAYDTRGELLFLIYLELFSEFADEAVYGVESSIGRCYIPMFFFFFSENYRMDNYYYLFGKKKKKKKKCIIIHLLILMDQH